MKDQTNLPPCTKLELMGLGFNFAKGGYKDNNPELDWWTCKSRS